MDTAAPQLEIIHERLSGDVCVDDIGMMDLAYPFVFVVDVDDEGATLLGGRHKEGRSRGTGHDPTSLKHRKGEGRIAADVVLNIGV